jgi:hypothetical protein
MLTGQLLLCYRPAIQRRQRVLDCSRAINCVCHDGSGHGAQDARLSQQGQHCLDGEAICGVVIVAAAAAAGGCFVESFAARRRSVPKALAQIYF